MSDETLNPELLDSLGQPQEPAAEGTQNLPGSPTSVHYVFGEDNDHIEPELKARFEEILEALRDVIDPELGINIVDLGLVYGIHLDGDFGGLPLDRHDRTAVPLCNRRPGTNYLYQLGMVAAVGPG